VIELKREGQEKRARRVTARPEPTIFGNCEGWNFIVGKKKCLHSPQSSNMKELQHSNIQFIHSLSTKFEGNYGDKLWVICGALAQTPVSSHIVDFGIFHMPIIPDG
jgi:hypothetical protein